MTTSKFVIMKHEAKKAGLHYDLRFKIPKSKDWDSYAIRKGVPTEAGKKVLAIKTTIHSEKEALLTGNITDGYGAGKLTKWDNGTCIIHKYNDKHITIEFKGSKVKGIYHMISTGFIDKDFKKPTYLLFKGKAIKEGTGMISRVPAISNGDEVEEGPTEEKGPPLKFSTSNTVIKDQKIFKKEGLTMKQNITESKNLKTYAMICQFIPMKGFFKKKAIGEYLIVALRTERMYMLLQFQQKVSLELKKDFYLGAIVGGGESPDEEELEVAMHGLRYDATVTVLEDKLPVKISHGSFFKMTFLKPSKYIGKTLELHKESRLPEGYYLIKCSMKKGFEPAINYKIDKDAGELSLAKKMRAFTSSRIQKILGSRVKKMKMLNSSRIKKILGG